MRFMAFRDGDDVVIAVKPEGNVKFWHDYRHNHEDDSTAKIVCDAINRGTSQRIESLVRRAYEAGWSDKSKKRRKRTNFTNCINNATNEVAW